MSSREDRAALAQIRQRWKVGNVPGSGGDTFAAHALADVGTLLDLIDKFETENDDAIRRLREESDAQIQIVESRCDSAVAQLRDKVDRAFAALRGDR